MIWKKLCCINVFYIYAYIHSEFRDNSPNSFIYNNLNSCEPILTTFTVAASF